MLAVSSFSPASFRLSLPLSVVKERKRRAGFPNPPIICENDVMADEIAKANWILTPPKLLLGIKSLGQCRNKWAPGLQLGFLSDTTSQSLVDCSKMTQSFIH